MGSTAQRPPRYVTVDRQQVQVSRTLEALLPDEHEARAVWAFLDLVDLSAFYAPIKSREGGPGRPPTDPKVLLALLLFAAIDGVGSARRIAALSELHDAYRWLRGGVPLNHHMLSDFRVAHQAALDDLLSRSIAVLLHQGLVSLRRVAQDGTRVRASAGTASFRGAESLERCMVAAEEQLEWVRRDAESGESAERSARSRAAQKRAAEERLARVKAALAELPEVEARRDRRTKKARASTTDAQAHVMKMGDGGFRPAYNVQLGTDTQAGAIVDVAVTTSPADAHLMPPMLQSIEARCGRRPDTYLVDAGYIDFDSLEKADALDVVVYGPLPQGGRPKKDGSPGKDPSVPTAEDSPALTHFRLRMASPEGQEAYKERSEVAELSNAKVKDKGGLTRLLVRGIDKVKCVVLLAAIAHNLSLLHAHSLL